MRPRANIFAGLASSLPWRFATSGVEAPGGTGQVTATGTLVRSRTKHIVYAHTPVLKFAIPVFKVAANVETALTGTPTYQAHLEIVGNSVHALNFSGAASILRPGGPTVIWTDPIAASTFGLSDFFGLTVWMYWEAVCTIGDQFPLSQNQASNIAGENYIDGGTTSYLVAGNMAVGTGTARPFQSRPMAGLGQHSGIAGVGYGDSIQHGQTGTGYDADAGVGGGWWARAWNGASRPYGKCAIPGDKVAAFIVGNNAAIRKSFAVYATHADCSHGLNDVANTGADDSALIWNNMKTMYAQLLAINPLLKISQQLIAVRASASSDAYATTAGQTISPGFANADAERPALDALITGGVGSNGLAASFTIKNIEADSVATDKWAVTGAANYATSDGVHPSIAMHTLMGADQVARVSALT